MRAMEAAGVGLGVSSTVVSRTSVAGSAHECECGTSVGVSCHTLEGFKATPHRETHIS